MFASRGKMKCPIRGACVYGTVTQKVLAFGAYLGQLILQNGNKSCGKMKNKLKWSHICESYTALKAVPLWRNATSLMLMLVQKFLVDISVACVEKIRSL